MTEGEDTGVKSERHMPRDTAADDTGAQPLSLPHGRSELDAAAMLDEVDVRELVRNVLDPTDAGAPPALLSGVQTRLRARSRGKFYGDGWSIARSPRSTYFVTSALMLLLIVLVFFVLIPWGAGAIP